MRAVAQVLLAPIAPDFRVDHELEVNAVAVAGDVVFFNHCTRAFPEVDAVAAVLFLFQSGDTRTYPCISWWSAEQKSVQENATTPTRSGTHLRVQVSPGMMSKSIIFIAP